MSGRSMRRRSSPSPPGMCAPISPGRKKSWPSTPPLMQFCLYTVMVFVLSFGSYTIISSRGLALDVGQFSALITYSFQILMSLIMVSMVFVMITMANESGPAHRPGAAGEERHRQPG